MASEYLLHRVNEAIRLTKVLRETLERRHSPDEVVESKLDELDLELTMLKDQLDKEK